MGSEPDDAGVNASKISFPMQLMLTIISVVVSVVVTVLTTTGAIASNVRDISTRLELRENVYAEKFKGLEGQLEEQKRELRLLREVVGEFQVDFYRDQSKPR